MNDVDFISASIVTYNNLEKVKLACTSILQHTKKYPLKLTIIDNNSNDGTIQYFENHSEINLIKNNKNIGFGAAHNKMLLEDMGKYHFVINPDVIIESDVLAEFVDYFENNTDVVMSMPKLLNSNGTEQYVPKEYPSFKNLYLGRFSKLFPTFKNVREDYTWSNRKVKEPTEINFCSGCFFGIRSRVFNDLAGFDERFFMYLEDADLTVRAKKYGKVTVNPKILVTHQWARESTKSIKYLIIHVNSTIKFLHKWGNLNENNGNRM